MRNQSISSLLVILCFCMYLNVFILGVHSQCQDNQRTLLLQLMNNNDAFYLQPWNQSSDCCTWIGVSCDVEGRVIGLDLNRHSFGEFYNATSLFTLQNLKNLNLAYQDLTLIFPSRLNKLKKLTFLNLSDASFGTKTLLEISQLTRLVTLDMSSDQGEFENINLQKLVQNLTCIRQLYLDGVKISAKGQEWCKALSVLPALKELSMQDCNLSGPFDSSLARLKNLSVIHLSGNNLSSSVPEFFADFTNLATLHLIDCGLSGIFPQKVFQLVRLTSIDISYNSGLHGSLPDFPPNGSLQMLVVSNTAFSGVLPNSINNLSQLSVLDLSFCQFHGTLPNSISKLTQLKDLLLESNNFIGPFPSSTYFKQLRNLVRINIENNFINGTIPSSLSTLSMLQYIQLSHNQFSELEEFSYVSSSKINFLDLSCNDVEGPIPLSLFQLTQLSTLNLSFNKLNGELELNKISMLRNLDTLDLSYNNLSIIDASSPFPSFPTISELRLASCNLTAFPQFLKTLPNLEYLDLSNNHIVGTIPQWIWNSTFLNHLDLSQNYLRDWEEPLQSISSNLSLVDLHSNHLQRPLSFLPQDLSYLDYSQNNISSLIPSNIGRNYPYIAFLSFSSNKIHGHIPASMCNFLNLQVLDLSNNSLTGSIPKCLVAMNGLLGVLNLSRNKLTGTIDTFPGLCRLTSLQLNSNLLRGKLPKYLATCKLLEVLDIGNNQINGKFPCWLENLPNLGVLVLRSNKFHGSIECPVSKASWSQLQIIDLASNGFSGRIPLAFFKTWMLRAKENDKKLSKLNQLQFESSIMDQIYPYKVTIMIKGQKLELVKILSIYTSVDLSFNKFKGSMPDEIGKLNALYILNLSHNALWGHIPSSLGNLKHLESLDLSNNTLSGEIPMQLASLSFLSFLNLSFNHLVGRIPTGTQLQSFEAASYKGNKGLCGPPLSQKLR